MTLHQITHGILFTLLYVIAVLLALTFPLGLVGVLTILLLGYESWVIILTLPFGLVSMFFTFKIMRYYIQTVRELERKQVEKYRNHNLPFMHQQLYGDDY